MMKKWKKIFLSVLLFGLASFVGTAQAASAITVAFGSGFPVSETNLAPGQTFSRQFTVTNDTDTAQSLMINFSKVADSSVAQKISLKIQKPDTTFATLPNNIDTEFLSDMYAFNNAFIFDTLNGPVGTVKTYTLIFTFDANTGNEFQTKSTIFDLAVGIDAVPATVTSSNGSNGGGGGHSGGGGNGGTVRLSGVTATGGAGGGAKTIPQVGGVETPGAVAGAEEKIPDEGTVQGAETRCISLSLWVWIALVLVFTAGFTIKKISSSVAILRNGVIVQIVFLIGALAVWYLFDSCRAFIWVPVAILIVAGVSMLIPNARHR